MDENRNDLLKNTQQATNPKPDFASANREVGRDASSVSEIAREGLDTAKQKASELTEGAREEISERGEQIKGRTAHAIGALAKGLRSAHEDMKQDGPEYLHGIVELAADGLDDVSERLDRSSANDLVQAARDFGRRNPVAFVAGSVLLGFAVARFVGSSSSKAHDRTNRDHGAGGHRTQSTPDAFTRGQS